MSLSSQQKRVIKENPHLDNRKLAMLFGVKTERVRDYRRRNVKKEWRYSGIGLPFVFFNISSGKFSVEYKGERLYTGVLQTAIDVMDHLIHCVEFDFFNMPRVEHPYFGGIDFGERKNEPNNQTHKPINRKAKPRHGEADIQTDTCKGSRIP